MCITNQQLSRLYTLICPLFNLRIFNNIHICFKTSILYYCYDTIFTYYLLFYKISDNPDFVTSTPVPKKEAISENQVVDSNPECDMEDGT